jgi:hypothetical protein
MKLFGYFEHHFTAATAGGQKSMLRLSSSLLYFLLLFMLSNSLLCMRQLGGLRMLSSRGRPLSSVQTPKAAPIQKTGAFISQLPEVYPADIYFKKALKKTREIKIDPTIKNGRNANRKLAAQVMDALMKALTMPVTKVLDIYKKDMKNLHPYEVGFAQQACVEIVCGLTLSHSSYVVDGGESHRGGQSQGGTP